MESRLIGKVISRRFRVEEIVGRGGMAIVYRAHDMRTHQTVALKVLREEYEDDPEYRQRFEREADVCRRLNHPNIVNMIASGSVGGISYIALEYVDGTTLKDVISKSGRLEQAEAVRCTLQILAALSHAHQRGVIHRDVKPQNVMVSRAGQLKIGDFGIAGVADTKTLTTDGNVMGSVHYFSPEQAKGMRATAASDLYSVGIMLYEMLTGHVPFEGETAVSVAMMHLMEKPKPVEEEAIVCPALGMIVEKSLEKQAAERYQSADAMTRDLRRALRHPDGEFMVQRRTEEEKKKTRASEREKNAPKRMRAFSIAIISTFVLALLALIGFGGLSLYRSMFVLTRVPQLEGLDEATALRLVESASLAGYVQRVTSDTPEGYVCGQIPASGETIRRGEIVTIEISNGSGKLIVPRLTDMTSSAARDAIVTQGFAQGEIIIVPSAMQSGLVLAQNPEAGTSADPGTPVSLTVSGGRVIVPEFAGEREEEVRSQLAQMGLVCGKVDYQQVDSARQDGVVLGQEPVSFDEVLPGTSVDLTVGYYDKRKYTANVTVKVDVPPEGVNVRVSLLGEDGKESDMYAAHQNEPGEKSITVRLRSEISGVMTWRLYLDGGFVSEATAVLQ